MKNLLVRNFEDCDEKRELPKTCIEVINFEDLAIMRAQFEPGWKWSECVQPTVDTESCQVPHISCIISGKLHIKMDDGQEQDLGPGDIAVIAPGHDAWVIGNEPCVILDMAAGKNYGKK